MPERIRIEEKIRGIAKQMNSFTYVYEDWTKSDMKIERMSLPAIIYLVPVSGTLNLSRGWVKDQPNCLFAFVDKVVRDADGVDNDEVFERMKDAAIEFVAKMNKSELFEPIGDDIPYTTLLEKMSSVVSGIVISLQVKELTGICIDKYLDNGR